MDEWNKEKKKFTPQQAKQKAEGYCAYQERAQQEVRDKLYEWGVHQTDVEHIISTLIEENFLNEERFAKAYALGKFRMKGWGKIKIKQHLKGKRVSDPLIRIALREIGPDEYEEKIKEAIAKRIKTDISKLSFAETSKLKTFLLSKGFEIDEINKIISTYE